MFFKVWGGYDVISFCAQVMWPSYIMPNEDEVTFANNFLDCQATVVLGPSDEQVLAKRFDKNIGPKAAKIQDTEGSYLRAMADRRFQALQKEKEEKAQAMQDLGAESLVERLDGNSKKRKKEHALKAFAKRAPQRKAKSLGSVISMT
jgi:ATPase subunit of ABC transporter with duplicated ATPase domains